MQQILQAIEGAGFTALTSTENNVVEAGRAAQLSAINPQNCVLIVNDGAVADLILTHGGSDDVSVTIRLGKNSKVNLSEFYSGSSKVSLHVVHAEGSVSNIVAVSLGFSQINYDIQLCGANAHSDVYTLQMGGEKDINSLVINMRHMSPDCTSNSLSKCVASGESSLFFEGLVYVAHDAQRTAASQNCRSIELSNTSHIKAQPQLEIYADDVKCSHGATMGQMDNEAIFYMRQRGLSETQARRVQIEGFIADVVGRCSIDLLSQALNEAAAQKLEKM